MPQLHTLLAGQHGVSAEMAMRLEMSLGSTADIWLRMQRKYVLAQMRKSGRPAARKIISAT